MINSYQEYPHIENTASQHRQNVKISFANMQSRDYSENVYNEFSGAVGF